MSDQQNVVDTRHSFQTKLQYAIIAVAISLIAWIAAGRIIDPQLSSWSTDVRQDILSFPADHYAKILALISIFMALAYFRILLREKTRRQNILIFLRFFGQLALGILWCYLIFVLKNFVAGFLFALQFATVSLDTGRIFYSIDRISGLMMAPQLIWALYCFIFSATLIYENMISKQ